MSTTDRSDEIKEFALKFNKSLGKIEKNEGRISELEDFANNFNNRLKRAYGSYTETDIQKIIKPKKKRSLSQINFKINKDKKMEISNSIFKKNEPWKPTYGINRYFEKFKKLNPEYEMNNWEYRVNNLIPRAYEKSVNLPQKKNILPQRMIGDYFDDHLKENKNLSSLGSYGEKLIETFKKQNLLKEKILKDKEEEIWNYKHSKPPVYVNPWKATNHQREYFSIYPGNKFYSYREVKEKKKFLISEPFYPPKKEGDYFYQRPSKAINHFGVL